MSRRREPTWAAISVPDIRRQWVHAVRQVIDQHSQGLPEFGRPAKDKRMERMQEKLAEAITAMKAEAEALAVADMYWVSRDMVDIVAAAADSLPAWTPALAAPSSNGFLCWAKPMASMPYGAGLGHTVDVPWDSVFWWTRPDGVLQVSPASRLTKHRDLLEPYRVSSPVWAAQTLLLNPKAPRTDEEMGSPEASRYISMIGAAWLLMGQETVSARRTIGEPTRPSPASDNESRPRHESLVTLVDVRRSSAPTAKPETSGGGRTLENRIPVVGHWRQTPCGPGRSQRKPVYIAEYFKGPEGAPIVSKERVHVLRGRRRPSNPTTST